MPWMRCDGGSWSAYPTPVTFICCHQLGDVQPEPLSPNRQELGIHGIQVNPDHNFDCQHGQLHRLRRVTAQDFEAEHWVGGSKILWEVTREGLEEGVLGQLQSGWLREGPAFQGGPRERHMWGQPLVRPLPASS
jgi:hypothetical protein